jgi:hypothetical protein
MSGKNTTLHGPHRTAAWPEPLVIKGAIRHKLEEAIGRALTDAELCGIAERCAEERVYMRIRRSEPSVSDVRRTLAAIGKTSPKDAALIYRKADPLTKLEIDIVLAGEMNLNHRTATGHDFATAATRALERGLSRKYPRGRRRATHQRELVRFALDCWRAFGRGEDVKVWRGTSDGSVPQYASPLLRWACAVVEVVERREPDTSQIEGLLKAVIT